MKRILALIVSLSMAILSAPPKAFSLEWFEDDFFEDDVDTSVADASDGDISDVASSNGKVSIEGLLLDHDIAKISIMISGMQTPVLGIAFHLKYDATMLSFLRYDPGSFLENGGDPFYLVTTDNSDTSGKVVFGETLRRDDGFPVGDGNIATFYFQRLAGGDKDGGENYSFEFENGVVSTLDTVRQDIDHVNFENFVFGEKAGELGEKMDTGSFGSVDTASAEIVRTGISFIDLLIILGCAVFGVVSAFFFLRFSRGKDRI